MSLAEWTQRLLTTAALLGHYAVPNPPPAVTRLSQQELAARACGGTCHARGAYIPGQGVLLLDTLDIDGDPQDRSVLLHELVHYLQDRYGRFAREPACGRYADRELEAYSIQDAYLSRYNAGVGHAGDPANWMPLACFGRGADTEQLNVQR